MSFNFSDGSTQSSASGILEKIWVPCDGRTITTKSGNNMSITNVTAFQSFPGASYYDVNGSSIVYTPPTGTTLVIYEFAYSQARWDAHGIAHYKFHIDSTEIVNGVNVERLSNHPVKLNAIDLEQIFLTSKLHFKLDPKK